MLKVCAIAQVPKRTLIRASGTNHACTNPSVDRPTRQRAYVPGGPAARTGGRRAGSFAIESKAALLRAPRGKPMENLATTNSPRLAGLKVLVIDDSKTIRRTAETLLSKEGCEVYTAVDGFDALSKIADHQPDIVFVDIMMPRLDGYQTCSLIKHNKVFRSIPVIMLSSKDGLFDRARGRIVGSEHYLTKPFTKDELLNAIETHVGALAR
jgi:twitching motility two-component system response regulator PilG